MHPLLPLLPGAVLALLLTASTASAFRLTSASKAWLRQTFARGLGVAQERVVALHSYDLQRAGPAIGLAVGRIRSRSGTRVNAGAVIYRTCARGTCFNGVRLGAADRVRALQLLDLAAGSAKRARQSRVLLRRGGWVSLGRSIKEPGQRARWPVLVLQTERVADGRKRQRVTLVSLKQLAVPSTLLSVTTLSEQLGRIGAGPRGRRPRFKGTRATQLRIVRQGAAPAVELMEKRLSTRFDRCRAPREIPRRFVLRGDRFVEQRRERPSGGCR